ncbi:uncharacterized protein LOC142973828 [Anticarsia gemmatalis]|uniref:uncharacterized protein LOC142973828 n=1 Tax=Anticarsia gemmatalis TaxID=129554 RepID=UPI003F771414
MSVLRIRDTSKLKQLLTEDEHKTRYRTTPIITTFYDTRLTEYDIKNFVENGLRIVRFRMILITQDDRIKWIKLLEKAAAAFCEKYDINYWPIALSIDIPNVCIQSGFLDEEIKEPSVLLKEGTIVKVTSDPKYITKCSAKTIFINDPYTLPTITPGTEINLQFGRTVLICTEVIDKKTIMCKVTVGGELSDVEIVCIRGVKLLRPALSKKDLEIIEFAKEYKLDMVTINSIRYTKTLTRIKEMFKGHHMPLFLSTICEEEGLENIDDIIAESDGVILAREFLEASITNPSQLLKIQMQISAKCKARGVPFYISGNILERSISVGEVLDHDLNDITNTVLQGSGFMLRMYNDSQNIGLALGLLNEICGNVEPGLIDSAEFWRVFEELRIPVNAAEACAQACILTAKVANSRVLVVLTVTGGTVHLLNHMSDNFNMIAVTTKPVVARRLLLYPGVMPIVYDKPSLSQWNVEMMSRVRYAVDHAVKFKILRYGDQFIVLRKSSPYSSFCDQMSVLKVDDVLSE